MSEVMVDLKRASGSRRHRAGELLLELGDAAAERLKLRLALSQDSQGRQWQRQSLRRGVRGQAGAEIAVAVPPIQAHLTRLVDRGDDQANLDRQQLDINELDLDIPGDDEPLVQDPLEDISERGADGPSGRPVRGMVIDIGKPVPILGS